MLKSAIVLSVQALALRCPPLSFALTEPCRAGELRRFLHARAENANRSDERPQARALDFGGVARRIAGSRSSSAVDGFPSAEQASPRAGEHVAHQRFALSGYQKLS